MINSVLSVKILYYLLLIFYRGNSCLYLAILHLPEPRVLVPWADPEGGDRGSGPLLKNHTNIGFLSNSGRDPLKKSQKLPS